VPRVRQQHGRANSPPDRRGRLVKCLLRDHRDDGRPERDAAERRDGWGAERGDGGRAKRAADAHEQRADGERAY
jgi:hypothetical protein